MTDIATVSSVLSSIKTATDIVQILRSSETSLEKAEAKLKLADLVGALADAKMEIAQVQDVLIGKDKIILELRERLSIQESLEWEEPYYWRNNSGKKDGPYCQHCYDKDQKLVRLHGEGYGSWNCKVCKNNYRDKTYQEQIDYTDYDVPNDAW